MGDQAQALVRVVVRAGRLRVGAADLEPVARAARALPVDLEVPLDQVALATPMCRHPARQICRHSRQTQTKRRRILTYSRRRLMCTTLIVIIWVMRFWAG